MSKLETLKAKHAKEIAKLEKEEAIRAQLPEEIRDGARICIHSDHASVTANWDSYDQKKREPHDARRIITALESHLVESEHWKDGCVSCRPNEINDTARKENSVLDGTHLIEVDVSGGKGYGPNVEVCCWVKLPGGQLIELQLPISAYQLVPNVRATYNNHGELANCEITWPVWKSTCDKFRTWWSEKPSYKGSYYSADLFSYDAWISSTLKREVAA